MSNETGVLLLDQNEFFAHFREMIVGVCGKLGCTVQLVSSEKELEEYVNTGKYKLLIIDPDVAGENVRRFKDLEVVVIQDMDSPEVREQMRKAGANELLARYYSHEEIAFVLNSILRQDFVQKREHPRILAGLPGGIEFEGRHIQGTVVNVSEGGAFLKSYDTLKPGVEVQFYFEFQDSDFPTSRVECRSKVIFVKPYDTGADLSVPGMGLRFLDIDSDDMKRIREFVEERLIKS